MNKHYVLNINPQAKYDWERCVLRNPITGERPDLNAIVAQSVGNQPGSYLISVNIDVQVLEKSVVSSPASKAKKAVAPTFRQLAS